MVAFEMHGRKRKRGGFLPIGQTEFKELAVSVSGTVRQSPEMEIDQARTPTFLKIPTTQPAQPLYLSLSGACGFDKEQMDSPCIVMTKTYTKLSKKSRGHRGSTPMLDRTWDNKKEAQHLHRSSWNQGWNLQDQNGASLALMKLGSSADHALLVSCSNQIDHQHSHDSKSRMKKSHCRQKSNLSFLLYP